MVEQPLNLANLNIDVLYESFKYLTYKERTRCERVNKTFGDVLSRLWLAQKTFAFRDLVGSDFESTCSRKSHRIRDCHFLVNDWDHTVTGETARKLLARCVNLTTVCLSAYKSELGDNLGAFLGATCPGLEHIIIPFNAFGLKTLIDFSSHVKPRKGKIKCIVLTKTDNEKDPLSMEGEHELSPTSFPGVESITVLSDFLLPSKVTYSSQLLTIFAPQLTHFFFNWKELASSPQLRCLTERGANLRSLCVASTLLRNDMRLICETLFRLKVVRFHSCLKNISLLEHLNDLENIVWVDFCCRDEVPVNGQPDPVLEESDRRERQQTLSLLVIHFMERRGLQLVYLGLFLQVYLESAIASVANLCPNLTGFGLYSCLKYSAKTFGHFASLQHLKSFNLLNGIPSEESLVNILKCPKLCKFNVVLGKLLDKSSFVSDLVGLNLLFIDYADRHPKRVVKLTLIRTHFNFFIKSIRSSKNFRVYSRYS